MYTMRSYIVTGQYDIEPAFLRFIRSFKVLHLYSEVHAILSARVSNIPYLMTPQSRCHTYKASTFII